MATLELLSDSKGASKSRPLEDGDDAKTVPWEEDEEEKLRL